MLTLKTLVYYSFWYSFFLCFILVFVACPGCLSILSSHGDICQFYLSRRPFAVVMNNVTNRVILHYHIGLRFPNVLNVCLCVIIQLKTSTFKLFSPFLHYSDCSFGLLLFSMSEPARNRSSTSAGVRLDLKRARPHLPHCTASRWGHSSEN